MKSNRRAAYLIAAIVLCVPLLVFAVMGIYLSDEYINGFTGMMGVMRIRETDAYVELTDTPYQLMIHREDAQGAFQDLYFDSWSDGSGLKDGRQYTYSIRAFTREFYIVLLDET